jgi:hypothetical protein
MNKLVYVYVPNEFVIGQVVLKLLIQRLAVAMVNKTVGIVDNFEPKVVQCMYKRLCKG